jgi:hypothetical protein
MLQYLKGKMARVVVSAAKRGNPMAQAAMAHETRKFLQTLPPRSPIVEGPFLTPDLTQADAVRDDLDEDYALTSLVPRPVTQGGLEGREVQDVSVSLGSSGFAGCGFFGLDFGNEWLIVPLHRAAKWLVLDGCPLEGAVETSPWIRNGDDSALISQLRGARITSAVIERQGMRVCFNTGGVLALQPPNPDVGFAPEDDLTSAVFLSDTPEIIVSDVSSA